MTFNEDVAKHKNLHDFLDLACDDYCESLSDKEYCWLIEGLSERVKRYIKNKIEML